MATSEEQAKLLLARIEEGVKAVYGSDNYRRYLSTMSKFHRYSYRNALLIFSQRPDAAFVKGYKQWKEDFNRQVQMGEKGIQILCPAPKKVVVKEKKLGSDGLPILDQNGAPVIEKVTKTIPRFIPVYVFDISQTQGDPLPKLTYNLDGEFALYQEFLAACRTVSPFEITFGDLPNSTNGRCQFDPPCITIRDGLSEAQTAKTLIHEIAHATMHGKNDVDRRTAEVQAESVAFCVCEHYGLDTSDYTFPYIALWSSGKELKELEASLEVIQQNTLALISELDERLRELSGHSLEDRAHDETGKTDIAPAGEIAQEGIQAAVRPFEAEVAFPERGDRKALYERPDEAQQPNEFRRRLEAAQREATRRAEEQRKGRENIGPEGKERWGNDG